jgi:hypothetical protein
VGDGNGHDQSGLVADPHLTRAAIDRIEAVALAGRSG